MVHRDEKDPEPSHASEFAAQTYFVWLAEASTSWGKTLLGKWFRERKTIWNCLQPALLRQYGSEFQFSVNKQPISECVSSFNVMSSNQHRLCSGNQEKVFLHSWERRCFVPFYKFLLLNCTSLSVLLMIKTSIHFLALLNSSFNNIMSSHMLPDCNTQRSSKSLYREWHFFFSDAVWVYHCWRHFSRWTVCLKSQFAWKYWVSSSAAEVCQRSI